MPIHYQYMDPTPKDHKLRAHSIESEAHPRDDIALLNLANPYAIFSIEEENPSKVFI